jgi:WS/DGAT/MGAT family acyltransferase
MSPRGYERLSTQDSSMVMFEHRTSHMHVGVVAVFEAGSLSTPAGGLDVARINAHIESRLHLLPRYRQKLGFIPFEGRPVWIDDERFNFRYHVRHTALPRPGDERALKALAGRIMSQRLDREKPLWEFWLVEGLDGDRFAIVGKVHHCMVDGAAGVGLLMQLLSPSPDETVEPPGHWVPRPAPSGLRLILDEAVHRARSPVTLLRGLGRALRHPGQARERLEETGTAVWEAISSGLKPPASTPLNRPIGPHRRIGWHTLDLALVKEVKDRLGGTINDVVLAVVTAAVRRLLEKRGAQLEGIDYRVIIPVNMRPPGDDLSSANRVSAFFLSLPVEEPDPRRRFERIEADTAHLKESKAAQGIDIFTRAVDWSGSTLLTRAGVRIASGVRPYNMIVTNVPGPQVPLYLLGARLLGVYPQLPLFANQGLGVAVMSYDGKVFWGMLGDWDLVPDLDAFSEAIQTSFDELRDVAHAVQPDRTSQTPSQ